MHDAWPPDTVKSPLYLRRCHMLIYAYGVVSGMESIILCEKVRHRLDDAKAAPRRTRLVRAEERRTVAADVFRLQIYIYIYVWGRH